jgi:hypothetical protein
VQNELSVLVFVYWLSCSYPAWKDVLANVGDALDGEYPVIGFLVVENVAHVPVH